MKRKKLEAYNELIEIMQELQDLGERAESITREHFPDEMGWARAYRIFDFGNSVNPYDNTFEKLLGNIEKEEDERRQMDRESETFHEIEDRYREGGAS